MSDLSEGKRVSFPGGPGQDPDVSDAGTGNQEPQPNYITREEAERLAEKAAEESYRRAQGLFDKGNQKVQMRLQEVERTIALNAAAGIETTPEQRRAMEQQALRDAYTPEAQPNDEPSVPHDPPPQQPAPVDAGGQDQLDPINAEAVRIMQQAGVDLLDGDPEVEKHLANVREMNAIAYLQAVERAAAEKAQRLVRSPQARVAGLGSGGPAGGDLESQYKAEMANVKRGDIQAIAKIKAKYQKKGLPVY